MSTNDAFTTLILCYIAFIATLIEWKLAKRLSKAKREKEHTLSLSGEAIHGMRKEMEGILKNIVPPKGGSGTIPAGRMIQTRCPRCSLIVKFSFTGSPDVEYVRSCPCCRTLYSYTVPRTSESADLSNIVNEGHYHAS